MSEEGHPQYAMQTLREEPARQFGIVAHVPEGMFTVGVDHFGKETQGSEHTGGTKWRAMVGSFQDGGGLSFRDVGIHRDSKYDAEQDLRSARIPQRSIAVVDGESVRGDEESHAGPDARRFGVVVNVPYVGGGPVWKAVEGALKPDGNLELTPRGISAEEEVAVSILKEHGINSATIKKIEPAQTRWRVSIPSDAIPPRGSDLDSGRG